MKSSSQATIARSQEDDDSGVVDDLSTERLAMGLNGLNGKPFFGLKRESGTSTDE